MAVGVPADRLLSSNLAALSACDLDLAKRVAQAPIATGANAVTVRAAASGWPTVSVGPVLIHSAYDPIAEAEAQANRVPASAGRVLALGFGAGHLLSVLLHRSEFGRVDVIALQPGVLRAVAGAVDLKPLLCNPRLRFLVDDKQALPQHFVAVPPLLHLPDPARVDLRDAALDVLSGESAAQRLLQRRDQWQKNLQANRAIAAADPGVTALFGKHPGVPVFIAAGGPSLPAQLPHLLRIFSPQSPGRKRAVLVCLPEALMALEQHGLSPNYVVAIDGYPEVSPMLRGSGLPMGLVYVPVVDAQVPAGWKGPRYVAGLIGPAGVALVPGTTAGGELRSDGSELLLAIDLSRRLGANALVLLGADLCLPPGQKEATPTFPRPIPGVGGKTVAAGASQIACRRVLEAYLFEHRPLPMFNTSPLGARISGSSEQPLADVLTRLKLEVNSNA